MNALSFDSCWLCWWNALLNEGLSLGGFIRVNNFTGKSLFDHNEYLPRRCFCHWHKTITIFTIKINVFHHTIATLLFTCKRTVTFKCIFRDWVFFVFIVFFLFEEHVRPRRRCARNWRSRWTASNSKFEVSMNINGRRAVAKVMVGFSRGLRSFQYNLVALSVWHCYGVNTP